MLQALKNAFQTIAGLDVEGRKQAIRDMRIADKLIPQIVNHMTNWQRNQWTRSLAGKPSGRRREGKYPRYGKQGYTVGNALAFANLPHNAPGLESADKESMVEMLQGLTGIDKKSAAKIRTAVLA